VQYLYDDGAFFVFMDTSTYEQPNLAHDMIGDDAKFLKEGMEIELLFHDGEVLDYNLPPNVDQEVVDAEMAVAGDTATGATKEVITEMGLKVRTPLFVQVGDTIRVDTRSGEYVTRV
jgi:elongation factor P